MHCAAQGALPGWVRLPASVALPFGTFEAVLQDEVNADVSVDFVKLAGFGGAPQGNLSNLGALREAVLRLRAPDALRQQLQAALQQEGALRVLFWLLALTLALSHQTASSRLHRKACMPHAVSCSRALVSLC